MLLAVFMFLLNGCRNYCYVLTLLMLVAISVLSLWPVAQLPAVPGTDKTHHFIAYCCLALPLALRRPLQWQWLLLALIAWSGAIELIQPWANRYAEWLDWLANSMGVALAWLVSMIVLKLESRYCAQ